jgi:hypothetical protein
MDKILVTSEEFLLPGFRDPLDVLRVDVAVDVKLVRVLRVFGGVGVALAADLELELQGVLLVAPVVQNLFV